MPAIAPPDNELDEPELTTPVGLTPPLPADELLDERVGGLEDELLDERAVVGVVGPVDDAPPGNCTATTRLLRLSAMYNRLLESMARPFGEPSPGLDVVSTASGVVDVEDGLSCTMRLFPVSATHTLPDWSTTTPLGYDSAGDVVVNVDRSSPVVVDIFSMDCAFESAIYRLLELSIASWLG